MHELGSYNASEVIQLKLRIAFQLSALILCDLLYSGHAFNVLIYPTDITKRTTDECET